MAELFKIKMQLKNQDVSAALRLLRAKSSRLPSYLVNKAVFSIAIRADRKMPKVLPSQIETELNASVGTNLVKVKSGTRYSKDKKHRSYFFGPVGEGVHPSVPLAALIIQAQVNPNSNFNQRTGNVFQRAMSPFKGRSRAAGIAEMTNAILRMLSARKSSSGFFQVCAKVVQQIFRPALSSNSTISNAAMTGVAAVVGGGNLSASIGRLAGGTVASGIRDDARASFWVATTEPDTKGKPGGAIFTVAQPVWQRAVDDEAASMTEYAETGFKTAARESGIKVS